MLRNTLSQVIAIDMPQLKSTNTKLDLQHATKPKCKMQTID